MGETDREPHQSLAKVRALRLFQGFAIRRQLRQETLRLLLDEWQEFGVPDICSTDSPVRSIGRT